MSDLPDESSEGVPEENVAGDIDMEDPDNYGSLTVEDPDGPEDEEDQPTESQPD